MRARATVRILHALNMGDSDFDDFLTWTRRRLVSGDRDRWEETAMDLLYLGLSVLFFGLSWALVKLCERL